MNDQDVCRFCLYQNNNFYHLFSEDLKNSDLHGKIINYLKIEVSGVSCVFAGLVN